MTITRLAVAALRYRWPRTALAASTVAMTITLLLVTRQLTARQLERGDEMLSRFQARHLVVYRGFTAWFDPALLRDSDPALWEAGIRSIRHVALTQELDEADPVPVVIAGIDTPLPAELNAMVHVVAGRIPAPGERAVALEDGLARRRGTRVGGSVVLFGTSVRVAGIFQRDATVVTADAYGPLALIQALAQREERANIALLELAPGTVPARAATAVEARVPELRVLDFGRARERLSTAGGPLRLASGTLSWIVTYLCGLVAMLTLLSSVNERLPEYAVFRSMGASRGYVFRLVLAEGVALAGLGLPGGLTAATMLCSGVLPRIHPSFGGVPGPTEMARAAAIVATAAVLGAIPAAVRAVRADPDVLLRH